MPDTFKNKYIPTLKGKIFRRILFVFSVLICLLILVTLIVQIPAVQNYLRNQSVAYLEKKLERKVSIDHLNLEWLSKIGLEGVHIEDQTGDTTLYAGHLSASIDMSIIALIKGKLAVHDIELTDVLIKDIKADKDSSGSLAYLISHMFPSSSSSAVKPKSSLELDLRDISFQRVMFQQIRDQSKMVVSLEQGNIIVKLVDLEHKIFDLSKVSLNAPDFRLDQYSTGVSNGKLDLFGDSLLTIRIATLDLDHGNVYMDSRQKQPSFNKLLSNIKDIKISLDSVSFDHTGLTMKIRELHAVDEKDFGLHHLQAAKSLFNDHELKLEDYRLDTRNSHLSDSIALTYQSLEDFKDFADKVKINVKAKHAVIDPSDLITLVPSLSMVDFFQKNREHMIHLDGLITGTINDLKSYRLEISMDNVVDFTGRVELANITHADETFISVRANTLHTTSGAIKDLVKGLSNLKNFDKLGTINFKGNFDGNFKDFVAYGFLKTNVGNSKMDMRLKSNKDINQSKYSGEIELIDFDLGKWTGNSTLGHIDLQATVSDGSSLRIETASAKLKANIKKLEYKNYTYSNVLFDGFLNRRLLDGTITMRDDNANLDFNGKIDFTQDEPSYNFESVIHKLDFQKLKLINQNISLSGKAGIHLKGKTLEEMIGQLKLEHVIIEKDSTMTLLESLTIQATSEGPGNQKLILRSDWLNGEINGKYALRDIWPSLKNQLKAQFPDIAKSLKLNPETPSKQETEISQAYRYQLEVLDLRGISNLLGQHIYASKPFKIDGNVNEKTKYMLSNWNIPDLKVNDVTIFNAVGRFEAKGPIAFTSAYIDSTINKDLHLPHMIFTADLSNDKLNFSIKTPKFGDMVNDISINGRMELIDSTYHMHLNSSQVSFLDRNWDILPDNEIAFRPGYIMTKNLRFVHGLEKIEIYSVGSKGLKAEISNLGIDWANAYFPLKEWNLSGKINLKAEVTDAFNLEGLKVAGLVDSIFINKGYFGLIDINAFTPNVNQPINISIAMLDGTRQLIGEGFYDINGKFSNGVKNNYQFKCLFKNYPLRLFEFLLDDVIDNTHGNIQGSLNVKRVNDKPDFSGRINITEGGLKVNYLNTVYNIGTQPIVISNSMIDVTGVQLKDEMGNTATLNGGLLHDHFKAFSLDAGISGPRFLVLKTTKEQNPDYYGTLVGNVIARFHGEFNAIYIDVKGITARPSSLNIPIKQATVVTSERVVSYRPKESDLQDTTRRRRYLVSKGVSVSIDLTANSDAEIALIFDEKRGDILKGSGNGDLQMKFERSGDITMYGNYEVNQGDYLFTLLGVVNKPFKIKQGGMIRWDGDPLKAQIDLDADYKGLSSSLINLLPEYENTIGSAALRTQAAIDLEMHLYGALFHPEISFNINIPNLTGDLRSIVDNKLNLLKSDQNALNQQVLGLMVWGSFLPPNQLVASSGVVGSTINNLSQFISSQLSLLVENALRELVADNNVISGFDFDVNYYNNSNVVDASKVSIVDEWNISLGPKFFEDRLSVGVGANFINSQVFDRLITPHFEVEYALTKDRRLKIKAYARKDDINQGQLKDRIGGGISWRKEFDSFSEFKKQLKEDLDQKKSNGPLPQ
jgi:hypothetical protein